MGFAIELVPGTYGEIVVSKVVQIIQGAKIFPNDNGFLKRIAIAESNMGLHPSTYKGVSGGIWQVDRISLKDTQDIGSHSGLNKIFSEVKEHFGINWPEVTFDDLRQPLYSGLAARILLMNKPERIPESLEGQAKYWKMYYNTSVDRGSEADFISRVQAIEGIHAKLNEMMFAVEYLPGAFGESVVDEVVQKIKASNIFPNDYGFLKRIAIVESNMGRHPSTFNTVHGGIWQVNRNDFEDKQKFWSQYGLRTILPKIKEHFGIDWSKVNFDDLKRPLYSALAVRLYFLNKIDPIPESLEDQAKYWMRYYSNSPGRDTEAYFIRRLKAVEGKNYKRKICS